MTPCQWPWHRLDPQQSKTLSFCFHFLWRRKCLKDLFERESVWFFGSFRLIQVISCSSACFSALRNRRTKNDVGKWFFLWCGEKCDRTVLITGFISAYFTKPTLTVDQGDWKCLQPILRNLFSQLNFPEISGVVKRLQN